MEHLDSTTSRELPDHRTALDRELDGLFEVSQALLTPGSIEESLERVASCLERSFQLAHPLVALIKPDGTFRFVDSDLQDGVPRVGVREVSGPVVARIAAEGKSVPFDGGVEHRLCHECDPAHSDPLCHFIGVPIRRRDELVGAIVAERMAPSQTPESIQRDLRILDGVAKLVGQTFHLQDMVARDRERLMEEGRRTEKHLAARVPGTSTGITGIVGESPAIQAVLRKIRIVAKSHLPVLLRGESGTGKELFAQAIHDLSPRRHGPMIKLNCAALPETMLETELFGHEKGAFTGAIAQRKGRFELADGGTLFLDEIGEISASFQAKLLRVLQEGEFERVGGSETLRVDVRLVAATNRDLEEAVRKSEFRADLYFRLCVVPIMLAPLRDRPDDIPLLATEFLRRYNEAAGTSLNFSPDALQLMHDCAYPGNIRELESCVRRTAAFSDGQTIHASDFACRNDSCLSSLLSPRHKAAVSGIGFKPLPIIRKEAQEPESDASEFVPDSTFDVPIDEVQASPEDSPERHRLIDAMERAGWVQAKAARILGLTPRQICYALRKHGIEVKKF